LHQCHDFYSVDLVLLIESFTLKASLHIMLFNISCQMPFSGLLFWEFFLSTLVVLCTLHVAHCYFKTTHSRRASQKSLPPEALKCSPGNSCPLCDGVTVLWSFFPALVPAWDCFFPTGCGFSASWPSLRVLLIVTYPTNSDKFQTLQ